MNNKKLTLEKFRIAKLENSNSIFGGSTACGDDGTKDRTMELKCIETSKKMVLVKKE